LSEGKLTNAASAMWRDSHLECIEVAFHGRGIYPMFTHPLFEEDSIVDTLRPRKDLLSSHHKVIRVGVTLDVRLFNSKCQEK
jgi:hypothetical protein